MSLRSSISDAWQRFQGELFPSLAGEVGPLGVRHGRFIAVLDLVEVERHVHYSHRGVGNPPADRRALARAFVAKAVWDMPTTVVLVDRLLYDPTLRRLCGWSRVSEVPSESTFSRAFAWFAETRLPERMHEALVRSAYAGSVVGHISRDSMAIVGRERPAPKPKPQERPKRKRGRPKKGGGGAEGADPAGAAAAGRDDRRGDGRRVAESLRHRDETQRQGVQRELEGVQTAYRRGRWGRPRQLHPDLGVAARQPGRDPSFEDDGAAGGPLLRAHGRGLRLAGDRVPRLPDGARGDHRHQPATRRGAEGAPQERGAGGSGKRATYATTASVTGSAPASSG